MKLKNYFTTIGGLLSVVGTALLGMGIVQGAEGHMTILVTGTILSALGQGLTGLAAKDYNQSHTLKNDGIGDNSDNDGI